MNPTSTKVMIANMPALKPAKKVFLLGLATALLVTSHFQIAVHAQPSPKVQDLAALAFKDHQTNIRAPIDTDTNYGDVLDTGLSIDKRSLIRVSIINGVASPIIQMSEESISGSSNDGNRQSPRFEMDHQVPPPEVLESMSLNGERTAFNTRAIPSDADEHDQETVETGQGRQLSGVLHDLETKKDPMDISAKDAGDVATEGIAAALLEQFRAEADAELRTYMNEQRQSPHSETEGVLGNDEVAAVNKWNKNHEVYDKDAVDGHIHIDTTGSIVGDLGSDSADSSAEQEEAKLGNPSSRGDRKPNRVVGHHRHHHHHHNSNEPPQTQPRPQQKDRQQAALMFGTDDVHLSEDSRILAASTQNNHGHTKAELQDEKISVAESFEGGGDTAEEPTSILVSSSTLLPPASDQNLVPEAIRTRGLMPIVKGAHHCTPQFCVNVSLSDDGKFATFHVERDLAGTGWISLGIGYAMTMADLIVLWPNPSSENGGGPNGAVLSRRASHAYVEPHVVGRARMDAEGLGDRPEETSLYPPNEYILHNMNSGDANADTDNKKKPKFIVQFTRPVRTRNLAHKLTPGQEQDFCWAYSPKPISPDSVSDPGAHISQHLSVGSFSMDVADNQPQLKEVLLKQELDDEKEKAAEKQRKKAEVDESNKKLQEDEHIGLVGGKHHDENAGDKVSGAEVLARLTGLDTKTPWRSSLMALQVFSCLVAIASMCFFR